VIVLAIARPAIRENSSFEIYAESVGEQLSERCSKRAAVEMLIDARRAFAETLFNDASLPRRSPT
jgi:hypothetical protein